jgi:succinate dehydrogenase flavin-adding protein (antitoxin of CptAB toxin-antitoxin module)
MLYSELSDAYKQHAWLSLMECLDEKIIWWTLNNDESKENIELTEF